MNKIKIISVNLVLLILVFCFAEFLAYKEACTYFEKKPVYCLKKENYSIDKLKENMRKPCGLEYRKAPILIYGCSYAYGYGLEDNETFGYQLSEKTKRPVYNFAVSSKGLQDALYLLQNDKKISPEPQYVFYVFINDHVRRMFINCNKIDYVKYLTYKNKNGKLVKNGNKYAISERFYLSGIIKNSVYHILKNVFPDRIYDLTKLYLTSIRDEVKMKYPDAKFAVIDYETGNTNYFNEQKIQDMQNEGIEIISVNQIFHDKLKSDKYRNPKEKDVFRHPNGRAWDLVTDYITGKYNL